MKLTKQLIAVCFICFFVYSFNTSYNSLNRNQITNVNTFELLFENNQIKIYSQLESYKLPNRSIIKNYLLLTVINKTNHNIKVNFNRNAFYNGKCSSYNSSETNFTIDLHKKESISGSFQKDANKALKVFHSFKTNESKSILTKLEISNILISKNK